MYFLTNRKLPRRTFLRGAGRDARAAVPRIDAARARRPRRPKRRRCRRASSASSCRTARRPATGCRRARRPASSFRSSTSRSSRSASTTVIMSGLWSQSVRESAGRDRRRSLGRRRLPVAARSRRRRPAPTSRSAPRIDQVIAQQIGQDNAAAVAAARPRRSGRQLQQLRRRLQLRLHEHDFLADAGPAAADGDQSAGGVRAHVRRRQLARAAQRAPRAQAQHSRLRRPAA